MEVNEILSRCSGVASSELSVNGDPVLAFPPVLLATQHGRTDDPSALLTLAAQDCREVRWGWNQVEQIAKSCSGSPIFHIHVPGDATTSPVGSFSPSLLANVFADRAFWKQQVTTMDTMVMYFRGGTF